MPYPVVRCLLHGPSPWCYVQRDGRHLDSSACRCRDRPSRRCPVDAHREAALLLETRRRDGHTADPIFRQM